MAELDGKFEELVYASKEVEQIIKDKYPTAIIKDASDFIHRERFELEIENVTDDEFYPFAIKEGFVKCCFGFELLLQSLSFPEPKPSFSKHERGQDAPTLKHTETKAKIEKWIAIAKAEGK